MAGRVRQQKLTVKLSDLLDVRADRRHSAIATRSHAAPAGRSGRIDAGVRLPL
jgi:hypothetical protein